MTGKRHDRVSELFLLARERPSQERAPFLAESCRGDPELRAEVESLLAEEERAGGFLEQPILGPDAPRTASAIEALVMLYESWGRDEEAVRYRELRGDS